MKKILLVSMFQAAAKHLKTAEPHLKHKTVTFIPTASRVEKLGFFVNVGKWRLKTLGLLVEELDVSAASEETVKRTLQKNDMIFVSVGNTFYLLQEFKRTGADQWIIEEVNKGKCYIGESAGAIVAAPDIGYSESMDRPELAPLLEDTSGLQLTDFYTVPHAGNWEFGKAAESIVTQYSGRLDLKVINDTQAILIEDDRVRILGR